MQVREASAYDLQHALQAIIASVRPRLTMTAPLTLVSLPLFPLHTVLYPGGTLPLRVFELRYRMMVRCCREQGAPFGVVTLLSGSEIQTSEASIGDFHAVGTIACIDSVTPLNPSLELIQCTGKDRFRITKSRKLSGGLLVGDVELLTQDQTIAVPPDLEHSVSTLRQVLQRLPQRYQQHHTEQLFADCGWVANRWCELFPMSEPMRLQLLEMDSPLLRLELITDALERAGIVHRPQTQP